MLDSIKITLKSHFCRKNVLNLSLSTQPCYGWHDVSPYSINHLWFIAFSAWRYFTPRRDILTAYFYLSILKSKKDGTDQETIQSST